MQHEDILLTLGEIAVIGLGVAALALLPLTFRGAPDGGSSALRLCSGIAACSWLGGYLISLRQVLAALRSGDMSRGSFVVGAAFNAVAVALFAWNVVAPNPGSPQRYVLALMCVLAIAGINFIITVLRPRA